MQVNLDALIEQAWITQFRDAGALWSVTESILAAAPNGSIAQGWGYVHLAGALRLKGDPEASVRAIASAEAIFSQHRYERGIASCNELHARERFDADDQRGARFWLEKNANVAVESRSAWEYFSACNLTHQITHRYSSWDESARAVMRALNAARRTNDPAAIGQMLSIFGGKHAEANNFETALAYCAEAFELLAPFKPGSPWMLAAINLLLALNGAGETKRAIIIANELLLLDIFQFPAFREQGGILCARAQLLNNDVIGAQRSLDLSNANFGQMFFEFSWIATQAAVFVAQRKMCEARAFVERAIEKSLTEKKFVPPAVWLRIYRTGSQACESLGELNAALAYERKAAEYSEVVLSGAARARRVGLEVEFEIDRERWEREEAQRRQSDAEIEGQRLSALNDKLDAALQTRTRFLAAASHDLRQPAHALALYAQALEHETSRPALVDLSKRMRATVGSLSNMFDGLLELARLDAGAVQPQQDVFDVNELLARLCAEYGDRLTHQNAVLKFRRTKGDCFVRNDGVLVERILRNLIGNAVKYAGEGNILVAARKRGATLAIEIRDAGPGMSAEEQRHIFDEFYRASSANARRDGLGLGLSIVERFARLLEMQVSVRSALGRGTTFTLSIPTTQLAARPIKSAEAEARATKSVSRRIAVIDDDPDARESMALVLKQWGHDCVAGESAADVLARTTELSWKPDALICDFQLRDRNAIADIAQLRETFGAALPVLLVSGSHDAQSTLIDAIPDASCLPKPIRPLRLKSWITALLIPHEDV